MPDDEFIPLLLESVLLELDDEPEPIVPLRDESMLLPLPVEPEPIVLLPEVVLSERGAELVPDVVPVEPIVPVLLEPLLVDGDVVVDDEPLPVEG